MIINFFQAEVGKKAAEVAFEECSEMARNEVRNFYHLKFNFYSKCKAVTSDGGLFSQECHRLI